MSFFQSVYRSPIGALDVRGEGRKISGLTRAKLRSKTGKLPSAVKRDLDGYFSARGGSASGGKQGSMHFLHTPLKGTALQMKVWKELKRIPWGQCISYGELARRVKKPRAVRAVASAVGKNPIAVFVPCHRVIASDGGLGGYAWGLKMKRWLLKHEQKRRG